MAKMITDRQVWYLQRLLSQTDTQLSKPIRELTEAEANWNIKRLKAILLRTKADEQEPLSNNLFD